MTVVALLVNSLISVAQAKDLPLVQVQDIANRGLAAYNAANPGANERLFEGYAKMSASDCMVRRFTTTCTFDATNEANDKDVYTPDMLTVILNRITNQIKISFEVGC